MSVKDVAKVKVSYFRTAYCLKTTLFSHWDLLLPAIIKLKVTPIVVCTVAPLETKWINVSLCLLIVVLSQYFPRKYSGA